MLIGGEGDHGHGHGDFRGKVWSMPGGHYCQPKHWKCNIAIAMVGVFIVCIPVAMISSKLEVKICAATTYSINKSQQKLHYFNHFTCCLQGTTSQATATDT